MKEYARCRISFRNIRDISGGYGFIMDEEPMVITARYDASNHRVKDYKILGSSLQNQTLPEIGAVLLPLNEQLNETFIGSQKARELGKIEEYKKLADANKEIQKRLVSEKEKLYEKYPYSFWSLHDVYFYTEYENMDRERTFQILNSFSPNLKEHSLWKKTYAQAELFYLNKVGGKLRNFKAQSLAGKEFDITKYQNKYIFLDFWASWCGPCRVVHPQLKQVYAKYKTKPFALVSISLDDSKQAWQKAVAKDALEWDQFSDLKKPSLIAGEYSVTAIPANILISPSGEIIARNLKPEELDAKLKQLFQ